MRLVTQKWFLFYLFNTGIIFNNTGGRFFTIEVGEGGGAIVYSLAI